MKKTIDWHIIWVLLFVVLLITSTVGVVIPVVNVNVGWLKSPHFVGGATGEGDQRDIDMYPAVAFDEITGRYLAVWLTPRHARNSDAGLDIYGTFLNNSGFPLSAPFRISDSNYVARNGSPSVAAGKGEFVVAWGARTNNCEVMIQKITDGSDRKDQVLLPQSVKHHSPDIVYNENRNSYLLVQTSGDDYLPPVLFGSSSADCGNNKKSQSNVEAVEFVMAGEAPSLINFKRVSNASSGAFRPKIAYNSSSNKFYVVWEDRRGATGDFDIAVFGQILDNALSPVGTNKMLSSLMDYQNFSPETTWTPRPSVAFAKNKIFAVWFEKIERNSSVEWQVAGKLLQPDGSEIKKLKISNSVFSERREDRPPAGFLDTIFLPSIEEFLVVYSMFQDSLFGYLSTVAVQRVNINGELVDLQGQINDIVGFGTAIDYALVDQLGAAVAAKRYSLPIAEYQIIYSRNALNSHAQDFDIWGTKLHIENDGLQKSFLPAQENVHGNGWQAGIQVQNTGSTPALISYSGITANGDAVSCGERTTLPGDSANFLTYYGCPSGHPRFNAGVVTTDQPAVAITNVGNNLVGTAQGQYRATSQQNAATSIFFPLVKHNHNGRTTAFSVQNTGNDPANITAVFNVNGATYTKEYNLVPGLTSVLILPADASVPGGYGQVGSLSITGSNPLAGASLEFEPAGAVAPNLQSAAAFSPVDYDSVFYCPLYRNNHAGKHNTSGLQVQNVSSTAQTVQMTYTPIGGGAQIIRSQNIEPGASATFYAPTSGIPAGSVGSVVVHGEEDIVAVVNEAGTESTGQRLMTTYQCFPAGGAGATVMVPLYKEFYKGNTSGIQVQNVAGDGRTATVKVTYRATNSSAQAVFSHNTAIPDGGSITFWGVSKLLSPPGITAVSGDPAALAGTYGSVVIESDTPIVAIANEGSVSPNGSGQDSKNYEGFNR